MLFRNAISTEQLQKFYPAIFAQSEKETLSDKYLYIPTYKLIEGLQNQGFKIVGAKQSASRSVTTKEHAKHVVYLSHESLDSKSLQVGEELPMLALTNSHNGLSSFAIDTAFFRLACSNGLLMPTSSMSSARIIHKQGMQNDVIEASYKIIQAFPEQIKQIQEMKSTVLSTSERQVLAESARNLAYDEKQIELNSSLGRDITNKLLQVRRNADRGQDLWTTFNVIQENIIKGGFRVVSENESGQRKLVKTRAVNSIDRDAKLNKELMSLAQKMAEIKAS